MRLAPVVLAFRRDFELAIHNAGESSRTTHAAPTTIDACRYFAGLLLGALEGRSKEELVSSFFYPAPDGQYWKHHPLDFFDQGIFAGFRRCHRSRSGNSPTDQVAGR